jgi:hypothetical protein
LFYKYGEAIRLKCKFAAEAAAALERMKTVDPADEEEGQVISEDDETDAEKEHEKREDARRLDKELEGSNSKEQGLDAGLR